MSLCFAMKTEHPPLLPPTMLVCIRFKDTLPSPSYPIYTAAAITNSNFGGLLVYVIFCWLHEIHECM